MAQTPTTAVAAATAQALAQPKPVTNTDTAVAPQRVPAFKIQPNTGMTRYLKALVYGEYGVGKTYWAATAAQVPSMQDVLLISAEGGDATLSEDEQFSNIDVVRVTNYKQVARVYDFLKLHTSLRDSTAPDAEARLLDLQNQVLEDLEDNKRVRRYRTIIVDSLTEVESYCMNQLLGVNDATKMDEEVQGAEWAEYKKQHQMVQRMIRNFRDLPCHIMFTCARAYTQDEQKRMLYTPMMTGKLSSQVQGFMDLVGYLVIGQAADENSLAPRRMYIQPAPRYAAKNRFPQYKKAYFDDPSVGGILVDVGWLTYDEVPGLAAKRKRAASPNAQTATKTQ